MNPWSITTNGQAVDLFDPDPETILTIDIAHSLGRQCRFAGNVFDFYSVAEHSWLLSIWLRTCCESLDMQLAALLHDAAEAYTGDITYPMQRVLFERCPEAREAYKGTQRALDEVICAKFDLDPDLLHHPTIREIDLRILLNERARLFAHCDREWLPGLDPLPSEHVQLRCWSPNDASQIWLERLGSLHARRSGR